jgi:uncharacterized flavoprotein (TIGR03862 family)
MKDTDKIIVVGAGPSGLFCSYWLLKAGLKVDLYDQMPSAGRKFLIAGHSGLNLTHSEDLQQFSKRYPRHESLFAELLDEYPPEQLRSWCDTLGVETFIGSSGRVFPKSMKGGELLTLWMKALKSYEEFNFYPQQCLVKIEQNKLHFKHLSIPYDLAVLALGGASWKKTGSDGKWMKFLAEAGFKTRQLRAVNSGLEIHWSDYLKNLVKSDESVKYIKNITLSYKDQKSRGDLVLTEYGVESSPVYAISSDISKSLEQQSVQINLDFLPDQELEKLSSKLCARKSKDSLSNFLRKALGLKGISFTLLKECHPNLSNHTPAQLAFALKNTPLKISKTRPMDEAISTAGGVCFDQLDKSFMSLKYPGLYFCGEILDWDAPTGGYLLQGCFSQAYHVAQNIISYRAPSAKTPI